MNNIFDDADVNALFQRWAEGYGPVKHSGEVVEQVAEFTQHLESASRVNEKVYKSRVIDTLELLMAADRICSASMWLIAHMTYADKIYLDGRELNPDEFKAHAQGHTGGALNMAPAYTGYLLANCLSGDTRAWLMGQGHCVAAIEAVNALMGNQDFDQAQRYSMSDEGLSNLCHDFYSYALGADGRPAAFIGSHVNAYTAGGISEGGYLGFAELQYVHMPLPGQELVTFLSDGAFEEQRGSDWAPHWWRAEDTGSVMPIMIANGRRIDQRTIMQQRGGAEMFVKHLALNGFDPFIIDGTDPAAYAMAILTMANTLKRRGEAIKKGDDNYPVKLPYAVADVTKGYGLPAAGTNAAHSLPLGSSLADDPESRRAFQAAVNKLHVDPEQLTTDVVRMSNHDLSRRVREKDHFMRKLEVPGIDFPDDGWLATGDNLSPVAEMDRWFADFMAANHHVRFKVGNPDEMNSNRMKKTLAYLKHRVIQPEEGAAESVTGGVITALNEETVVSAVLANKQGVGMVVSYEAFAAKMLGAIRQEVIFARHLIEAAYPVLWVSIPIIVTSHTWENGKNEQSHQDPTFSECCLNELSDVAPVYFPIDANTGIACLKRIFSTSGRIATIVAPKKECAVVCEPQQVEGAIKDGMCVVSEDKNADIQLIAIGSYQLHACIEAAKKMRAEGIACSVIALIEPGRFRQPRDVIEASVCHSDTELARLIQSASARLVVTHTRAEIMTGLLRRLDLGPQRTQFIGYRNQGGTLDADGMRQLNGQDPTAIAEVATRLLGQRCA
ncbi:MAG TPA: xylulose 5-phosphate 3-epimerase [Marinagarivorans sp.]